MLAAILIPSGIAIHRSYADRGLAGCLEGLGGAEFVPLDDVNRCEAANKAFRGAYQNWQIFGTLLAALPLPAGLFWGAPLVARTTEAGTQRLIWTRGVTRRRWAVTKFGLVCLAVVVASVAYTVLVTWWLEPLAKAYNGGFGFIVFDLHGAVPIGYAVFAVALGIFAGALTQKVLPAMAVTLVGFVAVRAMVEFVARPLFLLPKERTFKVATTVIPNPASGDWLISHAIVDPRTGTFDGGY